MVFPVELMVLVGAILLASGFAVWLAMAQRSAARERAAVVSRDRDRLAERVTHDDVTGMVRREEFLRLMEQRLRARSNVAVLVVDLEGLQRIYATHGHDVGDAVAVEAARRVRAQLGSLDVAGRLSAGQFAGLLRGVRSQLQAEETARRLVEAFAAIIDTGEITLVVEARVGVAVAHQHDDTSATDLLRDAGMAVGRAHGQRGSSVAVFDDRDRQVAADRHRLERDLRHAIGRGELELHLQPLVAADSLAPRGFEALIRWRHPEQGLVSPATFIPIAEETGAILDIGTWVVEEGCRVLRRLHEQSGSTAPYVSLNVSGRQLMDPRLPMTVASALAATGAPAGRLVLEVTETVMMHDIDTGLVALEEFAAMGVGVALDDFGTGYSSLTYLSRVPATHLKVDRSFVQRVLAGTADRRIVGAVIALARGLGLTVVAEGVETREEAETLEQLGADTLQGYWVARPMPADEAIDWFIRQLAAPVVAAPVRTIHLPEVADDRR